MFCPSCGAAVQTGQKFCIDCGAALAAITAAPTPVEPTPVEPTPAAPIPRAPTFAPPPAPGPLPTPAEPTAAFTVVEQTSPIAPSTGHAWDNDATAALPTQTDPITPVAGITAQVPFEVATPGQFRVTPLLVVAVLAGVLAVASGFLDVASYEISGDLSYSDVYKLNDFSTNNVVGAIIAAILLIGGAALGATGRRVGSGLAAGAGLALGGMVAMIAGSVVALFDATEVGLLGAGAGYTLTTTYEIGFFLAVAASVLGFVVFLLALRDMGADGHPVVTPLIGVIGALGTVAVVFGPLIPQNGASFADNFSQDVMPPATLLLRLVVLVLILVGGVLGFLLSRRWGLGLALGAISVGAWQWLTAITESGDIPVGIAGGNFFADSFKPHAVTTIGVVVMVIAGLVGLLAAAQQSKAR